MGDPQYLPMNKKIWKISTLLIITGILINIISFNIKAEENSTYTVISANNCNQIYSYVRSNHTYYYYNEFSIDMRAVRIDNGSNIFYYFVSDQPGYYLSNTIDSSSCPFANPPTNSIGNTTTVNNKTYYYIVSSNTYQKTDIIDIPVFNVLNEGAIYTAVYYTYGDGAISPEPEINWGELIISYRQNIYTEHPENNLDMISWNAYMDTAGNDLKDKNIEIQAIAGYFEGSSYADLKQTRFSDWLASTHPAVTMYKGNIELSHQEYDWGMVASNFRNINTLGTWFWNIFTNEGTWYQYGWRYQARLLDEDLEPLTDWQLIYTGNSYSPSATETLTDDEPLTPDDVDTINDINDENGTTNNWYINNTVITNNEYNQTYQQNIIENIYNILQGTPDDGLHNKAEDVQQTVDNAIDTEDDYLNDLQTQLNDIELNDITQNNGLMKALRWVREVHHETIETTVIGPIVLTIMLIGLITYLIGRRNG